MDLQAELSKISLPPHTVNALLDEILKFWKDCKLAGYATLAGQLQAGLQDTEYRKKVIQLIIECSTITGLLLTFRKDHDFAGQMEELMETKHDKVLNTIKREIVGRSMVMNEGTRRTTKLPRMLIQKRAALYQNW